MRLGAQPLPTIDDESASCPDLFWGIYDLPYEREKFEDTRREDSVMKHSEQKIRTSHCGRLPNPPGFDEVAFRLAAGLLGDDEVGAKVVPVVADTVKRQGE